MGVVVSSYEERKKVLENILCVDEIMYQRTLEPLENISVIYKKYPEAQITIYHGNDWTIVSSEEYLKSIGGEVVLTEYYGKMRIENTIKALNNLMVKKKRVSKLLSTKANTLLLLKDRLRRSKIEEIFIFTVDEFEKNPQRVCKRIKDKFKGQKIIVRSSASNEDSYEYSNAGCYESVLNVDSASIDRIFESINVVIKSYVKNSLNGKAEQVLVQPHTLDVDISGVIFTRDIHQNRPYYLINYDNNGLTDSVTSGAGGKSIWIAHDTKHIEMPFKNLIEAVKEIEVLLKDIVLDIEFAINNKGEVIIFQVRPLVANYKFNFGHDDKIFFNLKRQEKIKYKEIVNEIEITNMMLSDMAFWNPSELIGANPRNLEYSLFREIITNKIWNEGLAPMGYTVVNKDLMYKIGNKPYVSLDYSFMSLIPKDLSIELSLKLLNFYKRKLERDLTAHDKIEFEIVLSCYDFQTDDKLNELYEYGFSINEVEEIKKTLLNMTKNSLNNFSEVLSKDLVHLSTMTEKRERILEELPFKENSLFVMLKYFKILIKDIKKYGTPQFSRQARYAFISRTLCKSLVAAGYFTDEKMEEFMFSIETVATEFTNDFNLYLRNKLSRKEFNKKYGHLRSGTFDIRADRYDQICFETSGISIDICEMKSKKVDSLSILDNEVIEIALEKMNLNLDAQEFTKILKQSFEQREYFKFEFTKSLSLALELLGKIGKSLDIDRKQLSYLEIPDILASEYYTSPNELRALWLSIIDQRRRMYVEKSKLVLPEIIINEQDIDIIKIEESRPNFITNKSIVGEVVLLEENKDAKIEDKIVVITKADPGFDWIFTKNIKGLITKYGGVASHMAIRCAEFSIPAAIGCGEKIYNYITGLVNVELDCKKGKILERMQCFESDDNSKRSC